MGIGDRFRELIGGGRRLGIELGSNAAAAVEVGDDPPKLTAFGASPHPGHSGKELGLWLRRWLPSLDTSASTAHVALVEGEIHHLLVRLPEMEHGQRTPAVRRELRQNVSVPVERLRFAHHAVGTVVEEGVRKDVVLVAAADRSTVHAAETGIRAAGLQPGTITTAPAAMVRAAELMPPSPGGLAMAYLAAGRCYLLVFQDGVVEMVREFSLRGDVEMKGRERITEELSAELRRSFLYFGQRARGASVDRVVLCGTLPQLRELTGPLEERLGVSVELYDSSEEVEIAGDGDGASTYRSIQPALAVALGAGSLSGQRWNLLSEEVVQEPRLRALRAAGFGVAALILLLIGLWFVFATIRATTRQARLDRLQAQVSETRVELEQARAVRRARDRHRLRQALLEYRVLEPPLLSSAMQSLSRLVPGEMVFQRVDWRRVLGDDGQPYWNGTISGLVLGDSRGRSQAVFTRFVSALGAEPEVEGVELLGALVIGAEEARENRLEDRRAVGRAGAERRDLDVRATSLTAEDLRERAELEPTETSVGFTLSVKLKTVRSSPGEEDGS